MTDNVLFRARYGPDPRRNWIGGGIAVVLLVCAGYGGSLGENEMQMMGGVAGVLGVLLGAFVLFRAVRDSLRKREIIVRDDAVEIPIGFRGEARSIHRDHVERIEFIRKDVNSLVVWHFCIITLHSGESVEISNFMLSNKKWNDFAIAAEAAMTPHSSGDRRGPADPDPGVKTDTGSIVNSARDRGSPDC